MPPLRFSARTFACDVSKFRAFPFYLPNGFACRRAVRARRITPAPPPYSSSRAPGRFRSVFAARGFRSICSVERNINNTKTSRTRVLADVRTESGADERKKKNGKKSQEKKTTAFVLYARVNI